MTSKKSKKGKTIGLNEFLNSDSKLVTVRATNWSEIVDNEEEEAKPIVVDIGALPTAPRGAVDIDYSNVPTNPPFKAFVSNLSFEIDDEGLRRIFADLNPKATRILREGNRSRGNGLVEFETRENLIEALKKTDKEFHGRKIRVAVSDKTDSHSTEGGRGTFGNNRSNRGGGGGEERPEMASTWKRAEPRSEETSDDRQNNNFNRERPYRDQGRSSMGNNSRNNQQGDDYGFGYPRTRDDRGGGNNSSGGGRDYNRQGQRNRYQNNDDENRSSGGTDRPRYTGRYSDTRDTRDRNRGNDEPRDDQRDPPRERQKLQLQPRTKPLEEVQQLSGSSSSINNVAADAGQSRISNAEELSPSIANTSNQQTQDSSINESRDEYQHQDSTDSTARSNLPDEQGKGARGAGASIFGGAKPVDTAARELEIEKKLQEAAQSSTSETPAENEEKKPTTRSYNRGSGGDRDNYRSKRSSNNDEYRDRRDEGRSNQGGDYHHRREHSGGRQYEDEGRRRHDEEHHPRRGGGHDRDRYGGPSRRDHDSNRAGKYNNQDRDNDRGNYRNRNQNHDSNDFNHGRSSNNNNNNNNNFNSESQSRHPQRRTVQRPLQTDDSHKLQLSNKFGMLDVDDLDDDNENDEAQSPSIDE